MAFDLNTCLSWGTNPFKDTASDHCLSFMGNLSEDVLLGNSLEGESFDFSSITSPLNPMASSDPQGQSDTFVPWAHDSTLSQDAPSSSTSSDNSLLQIPGSLPEIDLDKFFDDPFPDIDLDQPVPDYTSTAAFIDPWRASTPSAQLECPYRLIGRNQIDFSPKSVAGPPRNELDGINYFPRNITSSINSAIWNPICVSPASLNASSLTEMTTPTPPNPLFHSPTNLNRLTPSPPSPHTPTNPRVTKVSKNSSTKSLRSRKDRKKSPSSRKLDQSPSSAPELSEQAKTTLDPSLKELKSSAGVSFPPCGTGLNESLWSAGAGQSIAGLTPDHLPLNTLHPAFRSGLFPESFDLNCITPSTNSNFSSSINNDSLSLNYASFGTQFGNADATSSESFSGIRPQLTTAGLFTPVSPSCITSSNPSPSHQMQPGVADQVAQARRVTSPSRASNTPSTSPSRCKPSASVFVNFTPKDSKKLLSGVAPSGSSKRKRFLPSSPCTPSKRRVVTT